MKKYLLTLVSALLITLLSAGQEDRDFRLSGYITTMQSAMFDSLGGPFINDFLIHNRLNLKYNAGSHGAVALELRNRLFTGDMLKINPLYPEMISTDRGWLDLSWNIISRNSFLLNTTADRFYIDLSYGKFQARIGRQRINWGQAFVWNPNDIFNAYSFFDFDYTERPGSDAVRLQYFPSWSSALEAVVKAGNDGRITAAGLYRWNRWGYDMQLLGGFMDGSDLVAGAGWSGSLLNTSFRGEATWFRPVKNFSDTSGVFLATAGIDRVFSDNSVLQLQLMYCTGPPDLSNFSSLYSGTLSAKNLAFSEFSAFGSFTWAATPLLSIGTSAMWFPDLDGYFTGPSLDYSMAENVDFTLIWQHFKGKFAGEKSRINLVFIRIKYSF
ncbi:MAG: hypothetical protein GYA43_07300 [Bacteroidales bacterium]|nr:hypothetical protein [Bacteroidales bacterium]